MWSTNYQDREFYEEKDEQNAWEKKYEILGFANPPTQRLITILEKNKVLTPENYLKIEKCLQDGADANFEFGDSIVQKKFLIEAISREDLHLVKLLLKYKANPNSTDDLQTPAFMLACKHGYSKIVEALLQAKADPNAQDRHGITALMQASAKGYSELVEHLLKVKNININIQSSYSIGGAGYTALIFAAKAGYDMVVQQLIQAGVDLDIKTFPYSSLLEKDNGGKTALAWAAKVGSIHAVVQLLKAKPDLNIQDKDGDTPLILAAKGLHLEIIELLLTKPKTDLSIKNKSGNTALTETKVALLEAQKELEIARYRFELVDPATYEGIKSDYAVKFELIGKIITLLELAELRRNAGLLFIGQQDSDSLFLLNKPTEILARIAAESVKTQSSMLDTPEKRYNAALYFFKPTRETAISDCRREMALQQSKLGR